MHRRRKSLRQKWRQFDLEYGISWRQWVAFAIVFVFGAVMITGIGI